MELKRTIIALVTSQCLLGCNQAPNYDLKASCDKFLTAIEAEITDNPCACMKEVLVENYSSKQQVIVANVFADATRVAENGRRADLIDGPYITINSNYDREQVRAFAARLEEDLGGCE